MKVIIKSILLGSLVSLFTVGSVVSAAQCTNDVWNKVMKRGKVVVGVKADYKPWGYRSTSGELIGMEIDMAKDVAAAMTVVSLSASPSPTTTHPAPISCPPRLSA